MIAVRRIVLTLCIAAMVVAVLHAQSAQGTDRAQPPATLKTPWGHPDLQGRWSNATLTPLERPSELGAKEFFTDDEAEEYKKTAHERFFAQNNFTEEAAISGEFLEGVWVEPRTIVPTLRTSLIVGPTGRVPALTPAAQKRAAARAAKRNSADSPEERPLPERCLFFPVGGPPMIAGIGYNSHYEITQTPTHVAIHIEQGSAFRIIALDGRPHPSGAVRLWQGDSRGRWEGDTLVVETANFSEKRDFRGSSANLQLVERFRRVSPDLILYTFTAEDPTTWTAPWTAEIPMRRMTELLYEFACHEGNYGLANILKGARATEARGK
jgi:hypothetical protein